MVHWGPKEHSDIEHLLWVLSSWIPSFWQNKAFWVLFIGSAHPRIMEWWRSFDRPCRTFSKIILFWISNSRRVLYFWSFPDIWILSAEVSAHSVCSTTYEDETDSLLRKVGTQNSVTGESPIIKNKRNSNNKLKSLRFRFELQFG
jgi:hypothetical protein